MAGLRWFVFVWTGEAKIRYLQYAAIVDQQIGSLHVAM
jgi:hypothetical protein